MSIHMRTDQIEHSNSKEVMMTSMEHKDLELDRFEQVRQIVSKEISDQYNALDDYVSAVTRELVRTLPDSALLALQKSLMLEDLHDITIETYPEADVLMAFTDMREGEREKLEDRVAVRLWTLYSYGFQYDKESVVIAALEKNRVPGASTEDY